MAKKKKKAYDKKGKTINKKHQIDHIPKYSQQRRSPGASKPRTDFSPFFCYISPLPLDLLLESPSNKEILSSVTIVSPEETNDPRRDILNLSPDRYSESEDKRQGLFKNCIEVPVIEVKPVGQNAPFVPCSNRNDEERNDSVRTSEFTPNKSQITENSDVCTTPSSVVWAKTAEQWWWPAEILGERSTLVHSGIHGIDRHILVQYYGKHESTWVDPDRDLSPFEECFEERSSNPTEEFQNALKQALYRKEHLRSCKQLFDSPDGPDCSNEHDLQPEKGNSSSSSGAGTYYLERGRSKRERKPKVHFDEASFPLKSVRKVRRFRIMRFLGLAAPVGSPFLTPGNVRG